MEDKVGFRFHTGSIKRKIIVFLCVFHLTLFRFHTGSIKSDRFRRFRRVARGSFDSILVRLKVEPVPVEPVPTSEVSIPYWFD